MTRWKAFALHLCLSFLVIGGISAFVFSLWYPNGLYRVSGLDRLLLIMLGIDLTAGPLLTLLMYRPGKWGLKFDLVVIGLAQLAFLFFGLHVNWQSRPVYVVGVKDQLTVVFASEIDPKDLAKGSAPRFRTLSWTGPQMVGTGMPSDPKARIEVMEALMAGGAGIERSPRYYFDYAQAAPTLLANARPATADEIADSDVRKSGRARSDLRWVPIVSIRGEGKALLDARTAELLRVVPLDAASATPTR